MMLGVRLEIALAMLSLSASENAVEEEVSVVAVLREFERESTSLIRASDWVKEPL